MSGPADAAGLLTWARTQTWAMEPRTLEAMTSAMIALSQGQSALNVARHSLPSSARSANAVAVLPITGLISYHPSFFSELFGGTTIKELTRDLQFAMEDTSVKSILMPISSPGGGSFGLIEFSAALRAARQKKRIVAVVDPFAGSAAYWLAAQATEIVSIPSGETGSVGVWTIHLDFSEQLKKAGIKPTIISSTPEKTGGHATQPLSAEARADIQDRVDRGYRAFLADVALGRGISVETVRAKFGQGRMFDAARAKTAGMIDRIATFDQALAGVVSTRPGRAATASPTARPSLSDVLSEAIHNPRRRRLALLKHGSTS